MARRFWTTGFLSASFGVVVQDGVFGANETFDEIFIDLHEQTKVGNRSHDPFHFVTQVPGFKHLEDFNRTQFILCRLGVTFSFAAVLTKFYKIREFRDGIDIVRGGIEAG